MPATRTPRQMSARELDAAMQNYAKSVYESPLMPGNLLYRILPEQFQEMYRAPLGAALSGISYLTDRGTVKDVPKDINKAGKAIAQNAGSYLDLFNTVYNAISGTPQQSDPNYYRVRAGEAYQQAFNPEPADPRLDRALDMYADPLVAAGSARRAANVLTDPALYRQIADELGGANRAYMSGPQAEALRVAQANAAKPIEEGGLGLRPDNTPEERAAAMGFTRDYFHGTERLDRFVGGKSIDPKRATSGPMPYGTDSPELASNYAKNKMDTSRIAEDDGEIKNYFTVSPKALGSRQRSPIPVEDTWYRLSPEQRQAITEQATRVGYSDLDTFEGDIMLHPQGVDATLSRNKWDWDMKNIYRGNALSALRDMWVDSGQIYREPELLSDIYQKAGYPYQISQETAPWYKASGVFTGKAAISNPLNTTNFDEIKSIIPQLRAAFAKDRTRLKQYGSDFWDKNTRYTPKQWVDQLEKDIQSGDNSYVWTSIPDKVTEQLKALGYDGIIDKSGKGGTEAFDVVIPFAPNQIRSRFAAFDPMRRDSSDLLAGLALPVVAAPAVMANTKDKRKERKK